MTMKARRLSMTGYVEECESNSKEEFRSTHSRDSRGNTSIEDTSFSSTTEEKLINQMFPPTPNRRKPNVGHEKLTDTPKKPRSQRRRSLFGGSPKDIEVDINGEEKKPNSRRRFSLFGSSTVPDSPPIESLDDFPGKSKPSRRRSLGGSSTTMPKEDDREILRKPPSRDRSGKSVASASSRSTTKSIDSGATPPRRGVSKPKSLDSPFKKRVMKGTLLFKGKKDGKDKIHSFLFPFKSNTSMGSLASKTSTDSRQTSSEHRRLSSGIDSDNLISEKPRSSRRERTTNGSKNATWNEPQPSKPSSMRRHSLTQGRGADARSVASAPAAVVNPHELVNKSRLKRGLKAFSRNMLMDTIAKQVASDLASSFGSKCTPTNYHGNVGQGETILNIHKTMMSQKSGTARGNLLSAHFEEIGIGISRGRDGLLYICQLFN